MERGYFFRSDKRARIKVKISGATRQETMDFEIDTGSSEELMISHDWADHLGITLQTGHWATLADRSKLEVYKGRAQIEWMGMTKPIEVTVWPRSGDRAVPIKHREEPDGLLGRRLVSGFRLTIDYVNHWIAIDQPSLDEA